MGWEVISLIPAREQPVEAVIVSGAREGDVVLLDPEVVSRAPAAEDPAALALLNSALDRLNTSLDRFVAAVCQSADEYAGAADRLERNG
jgi:hypothetical protein